jgi:hypothetical protein
MSRVSEVIKNKNSVSRQKKARQKEELSRLNKKTAFKAALSAEMKHIDVLLNEEDIDSVIIQVPENMLSKFGEAIFSPDMAGYEVEQVPDEPDKFEIRYRMI